MEPVKQSGVPPSRPSPPSYPGAPPSYMDLQGGIYPMGPPGGVMPYGAPTPAEAPPPYYAPTPNHSGYPTPGVPQVYSLYPDVSQLPQPQAGTVPYSPITQVPQHAILYPGATQHPSMPYSGNMPVAGHMPSAGHNAMSTAPIESPPAYEDHMFAYEHTSLQSTPMGFGNYTDSRHGEQQANNQTFPLGFMAPGAPPIPPSPCQTDRVPKMGAPSVPLRPAPSPPGCSLPTYPLGAASQQEQIPWWTALKDGEVPSGCVISWKGGDGSKIYFIQEDGHIVSPNKPLQMAVYKRIPGRGEAMEEALVGMVEVLGSWRLRLHGKTTYTLHTYSDTYVFRDDSTCPRRIVIIELPADVTKTMRTDLLTLLKELTDLREEQEGVVGKLTTNVETVYTDITKKINTVVKDTIPGAHKSTKWLRKGTGNLVRMGGNLVSKGMHLIADQMPANQPENEEESPVHNELMDALIKFRKSKEEGTITFV